MLTEYFLHLDSNVQEWKVHLFNYHISVVFKYLDSITNI